MEEYKRKLISHIDQCPFSTIEKLEKSIKYNPRFTINKNEEGKIHSHYLGDRYEPAIINVDGDYIYHYYLFDGEVRDCSHPFSITYHEGVVARVTYYSSERIKNNKPICVSNSYSSYNILYSSTILSEYECKIIPESNNLEKFTLLCDEMEEDIVSTFKFAD